MLRKIFISLVLLFFCAACTPEPYDVGSKTYETRLDAVRADGVQTIENGYNLRFILPNDQFFIAETDQLQPSQRDTLTHMATVILSYRNPQVFVNGYMDNSNNSPSELRRISYNKAHVIAAFLWSQGVPVNVVQVQGLGAGMQDVADNATPAGSAANRRVEVLVVGE